MQKIYQVDETEARKLAFLYRHSGIENRYSVIPDYGMKTADWTFFDPLFQKPLPPVEERMKLFDREACDLSTAAIRDCVAKHIAIDEITHLITVSCTGLAAPGLDLQIVEKLKLNKTIFRTSVNFMGCYAAIHALKMAKMICDTTPGANVVVVASELCTLHFQNQYTPDNVASSLLFGDGSAAILLRHRAEDAKGLKIENFYSSISFNGKNDMTWSISSSGFLMSLSSDIPTLIAADIEALLKEALDHYSIRKKDITHWCIHPGGKRILQVIKQKLQLTEEDLCFSKEVLLNYGNMSSPTVLFILKEMVQHLRKGDNVFCVGFGPGLTMETALFKQQ